MERRRLLLLLRRLRLKQRRLEADLFDRHRPVESAVQREQVLEGEQGGVALAHEAQGLLLLRLGGRVELAQAHGGHVDVVEREDVHEADDGKGGQRRQRLLQHVEVDAAEAVDAENVAHAVDEGQRALDREIARFRCDQAGNRQRVLGDEDGHVAIAQERGVGV